MTRGGAAGGFVAGIVLAPGAGHSRTSRPPVAPILSSVKA